MAPNSEAIEVAKHASSNHCCEVSKQSCDVKIISGKDAFKEALFIDLSPNDITSKQTSVFPRPGFHI